MKKVLISLIMLVPLITGCANVDTMLTINDDKSATVATSLTYQGNLSSKDDLVALNIADSYKSFIDSNYKVDTAYGAKLSTITATKSVKDLGKSDIDLSSLGLVSNLPSKKFVEVKKSFLLSSFNIDCTYDASVHEKQFKNVVASSKATPKTVKPEYFHKYADKKVGVMVTEDIAFGDNVVVQHLGTSPEQYAHNLFKALRFFDDKGVDVILSQDIKGGGICEAVRNRLYKAANNR